MKNILSIFLFTIVLHGAGVSQTVIEGYVKDKASKNTIPYVNIGIIGKNAGTVSRADGWFRLLLDNKFSNDSLRFSIIGYRSLTVKVSDAVQLFKSPVEIFLETEAIRLQEVVITDKPLKKAVLGNKTESVVMQAGFTSNELGNEVGIAIKIKKTPAYIEKFNIFISDNTYDTLKFRINIYNLKDGMPGENLMKQPVVVYTTLKRGRLSIDLSKYNIVAYGNVFASLEWIEDLGKSGLYFSASFGGSPVMARHTSQGNWEKVGPISLGINLEVKY